MGLCAAGYSCHMMRAQNDRYSTVCTATIDPSQNSSDDDGVTTLKYFCMISFCHRLGFSDAISTSMVGFPHTIQMKFYICDGGTVLID